MVKAPLIVRIDPASALARALADTGADVQVILDTDGVRYIVQREDGISRFDEQAVLRGLRESRGALKGVDTETLLSDLTAQRSQFSSGRPD